MPIKRYHFPKLASTNDWAKDHLESLDEVALHVITADEQTAGRGQYGRTWISNKGENLHLTFAFHADECENPLRYTHLLALTVAQCFPTLCCQVKWPNDLRVKGKKLGGILCETQSSLHGIGIILGIGLNINLSDTSKIDQPATSFLLETGKRHSVKTTRDTIIKAFESNLLIYKQSGFTPFIDAFKQIQEPSYQEQLSSLDAPSS